MLFSFFLGFALYHYPLVRQAVAQTFYVFPDQDTNKSGIIVRRRSSKLSKLCKEQKRMSRIRPYLQDAAKLSSVATSIVGFESVFDCHSRAFSFRSKLFCI